MPLIGAHTAQAPLSHNGALFAELMEHKKRPSILASEGLSLQLAQENPHEYLYITVAGSMLAGAAGFVNGCTLLALTEISHGHHKSFTTSHMTGTTTVSALGLGENDYEVFAISLCLIISFCFGAFLAGCSTSAKTRSYEIGPEYGPQFLFLSVLLTFACVTAYVDENSVTYYYLAAMAMGFQNSVTSKYSGSLIRTTHVTGTVTDVGLILGQYTQGVTKDLWKLPVLVSLLVSFSVGGVLSVAADTVHNKLGLIIVAVFYFCVAVFVQSLISRGRNVPFFSFPMGISKLWGGGVSASSSVSVVDFDSDVASDPAPTPASRVENFNPLHTTQTHTQTLTHRDTDSLV